MPQQILLIAFHTQVAIWDLDAQGLRHLLHSLHLLFVLQIGILTQYQIIDAPNIIKNELHKHRLSCGGVGLRVDLLGIGIEVVFAPEAFTEFLGS